VSKPLSSRRLQSSGPSLYKVGYKLQAMVNIRLYPNYPKVKSPFCQQKTPFPNLPIFRAIAANGSGDKVMYLILSAGLSLDAAFIRVIPLDVESRGQASKLNV
jgi:hypothetical protein